MIKDNKVSLWLGNFKSYEEFENYVEIKYDEDGNYIKSEFQKEFNIDKYDLESTEKDWIVDICTDANSLLAGFSYDYKIIPEFEKMINKDKMAKYNSILLLYNFEYEEVEFNKSLDYIGCVDVN